jgi:hypothetical protein
MTAALTTARHKKKGNKAHYAVIRKASDKPSMHVFHLYLSFSKHTTFRNKGSTTSVPKFMFSRIK